MHSQSDAVTAAPTTSADNSGNHNLNVKRPRGADDNGAHVKIYARVITPSVAEELLAAPGIRRPENRQINGRQVSYFARLMTQGLWRPQAQPVMLDSQGRLLDGQHRLTAVMVAGIPVEFLIAEGYDASVLDVIDTGKPRTAADVLSMHGIANTRNRAAALRLLANWENVDNPWKRSHDARLSPAEIWTAADKYPELDAALYRARRLSTVHIPGGDGFWAPLFYRFAQVDADAADAFAEGLRDGADLPKGSPILLLRNRLVETVSGDRGALHLVHRRRSEGTAALIIKAWNAWYSGKPMRVLKWVSQKQADGGAAEPFPVVYGFESKSEEEAA